MPKQEKIRWLGEEDEELRRIYALSKAGPAAAALRRLAEQKGVAPRNCRDRAHHLGLSRTKLGRRRWTVKELEALKQYAGRITVGKIARLLRRTDDAVIQRLHRLALSGRVKERGYMRIELADCLGVDLETLRGLLKRFPLGENLLGNFKEDDVQLWVWDHLEDLELRKMDQAWLKAILRRAA